MTVALARFDAALLGRYSFRMQRWACSVVLSLLIAAAVPWWGCKKEATTQAPEGAQRPGTTHGQTLSAGTAQRDADDAPMYGRWKGPTTCLELYPTGEFQLSVIGRGPKIVLTGLMHQRRIDGAHIDLDFRATRIYSARWVSACRKRVSSARLLAKYAVLGTELAVNSESAVQTMRLRVLNETSVQLCGVRCEVLVSETPRLFGMWRNPGILRPSRPTTDWDAGEALHLELAGSRSRLWIGSDHQGYVDVLGAAKAKGLAPGRFRVEFTPNAITRRNTGDVDADSREAAPSLFGAAVRLGTRLSFTVERVKGGVELCGTKDNCVRLPFYSDVM